MQNNLTELLIVEIHCSSYCTSNYNVKKKCDSFGIQTLFAILVNALPFMKSYKICTMFFISFKPNNQGSCYI